MFSFKKFTAAAGTLAAALMVSTIASAAPIGHTSFGVTGGFTVPAGTDLGNTNSVTITNGGAVTVSTPDPYSLSGLVTLGEAGTLQNLTSLSAFTPIMNYLTLSSGVTIDLLSLMINGRSGGPPGFLNMSGAGVLHAPGFDPTSGILSLTGTTTDNLTFSFAVEASNSNPVPEPVSLTLLGAGLLGIAFVSRRRITALTVTTAKTTYAV